MFTQFKKDLKFLIVIVPLFALTFEIVMRCLGFGYFFDNYQKELNDSLEQAIEESNYMDSKLIGTWRVSDCEVDDLGKCDIVLTFGSGNFYSEAIIPKGEGQLVSNAKRQMKGTYYVDSGRIVLIPLLYKDGKKIVNHRELQENVTDYAELFDYSVNKDGLTMEDSKTGQTIQLKKML